jgi:hypothetical protein
LGCSFFDKPLSFRFLHPPNLTRPARYFFFCTQQPYAELFGLRCSLPSSHVLNFSEEVVRDSPLFVGSLLAAELGPRLRAAAGASSWTVRHMTCGRHRHSVQLAPFVQQPYSLHTTKHIHTKHKHKKQLLTPRLPQCVIYLCYCLRLHVTTAGFCHHRCSCSPLSTSCPLSTVTHIYPPHTHTHMTSPHQRRR